MSGKPRGTTETVAVATVSWLPLVVVVLTQIQTSFAVNALTVSMAEISADLTTPATSIGTAITAGTFAMAAFILLGAKIGARYGTRRVFQIAVAVHGLAMAAVALSHSAALLFVAQAASGAVIALIAPALTVLIATNFSGDQQAKAIGYLAAAIPAAGVLALVIAGSFASSIGWRYSFALIVVFAVVNLLLSFKISPVAPQKDIRIDWVGALLAAVAVILLSFGFSGLNSWGVVLATDAAPFSVVGVSPAAVLILLGALCAQGFFQWTRRMKAQNKPQLFDLDVLRTGAERATTVCMATMMFVGTAANFLIPLYMQIVQGRSSLQTSFSIIPYTLSIFVASTLAARFYKTHSPRLIARAGFVVVAAGLMLLAFTIRGDWHQIFVVVGLITLGLGQGAVVALVFNTLLTAAPKELAGDVGAWRGLVHNISGSVGIAVASVFAVGILGTLVSAQLIDNPTIPAALKVESGINLDEINFIPNDHIVEKMEATSATPEQVDEAVRINTEARLRALRTSLLVLAGLSLLAIVPAGRMPGKIPE